MVNQGKMKNLKKIQIFSEGFIFTLLSNTPVYYEHAYVCFHRIN